MSAPSRSQNCHVYVVIFYCLGCLQVFLLNVRGEQLGNFVVEVALCHFIIKYVTLKIVHGVSNFFRYAEAKEARVRPSWSHISLSGLHI